MKEHILQNCFNDMPFIRLLDDGSMEDEAKMLSDVVMQGMRQDEERAWYRYAAISTSVFVDKYNGSKNKKGADINIEKLREILIDARLLQAEGGKNLRSYRPTVNGKFKGIAIGAGIGNDGGVYEVPYYTDRAEYVVLELIAKKIKTKGAE